MPCKHVTFAHKKIDERHKANPSPPGAAHERSCQYQREIDRGAARPNC